ncbi:ATP-binding protein [Autumnicola patrickiae]|uniref:ATP-binding protein n=1 Tax=Autumnicola patrickiae TaxID=3075591 RepID=UPI003D7765E9
MNCSRDIKVEVYDDMVNILSPGSSPNNITIEKNFKGRSESRNRVFSNIFKRIYGLLSNGEAA